MSSEEQKSYEQSRTHSISPMGLLSGLAGQLGKEIVEWSYVAGDVLYLQFLEWGLVVLVSVATGVAVTAMIWYGRIWYLGGTMTVKGYVAGEVLGRGGFGEVSRGHSIMPGSPMIAMKVPYGNTAKWSNEAHTLKRLNPPPFLSEGFAKLVFVSQGIIGMNLLGPSLESVKKELPQKKFSLKTTLLVAEQALNRLFTMHHKRTLHRDVKPENFLLGLRDDRNIVHIVDFGLSERFYDTTLRRHKAYREGCTVYGTPYFSSLNADCGCEQGRRDDIESLGYTLVYLAKGTLPWIGLKSLGPRESWHKRVCDMKANMPLAELCEGLPSEFSTILTHARSLKFTDKPNYAFLQEILARRFAKLGYAADNVYDWSEEHAWKCWEVGGTPAGVVDVDRE